MRCLWYALRKEWKEGGYIKIRRMRIPGLRFLPHFLHESPAGGVTHMAGTTHASWWRELWYMLTGRYYTKKDGDN